MHHFPIAFALAPNPLGSIISGGALVTTVRALLMVGHVTVKLRWTTPGNSINRRNKWVGAVLWLYMNSVYPFEVRKNVCKVSCSSLIEPSCDITLAWCQVGQLSGRVIKLGHFPLDCIKAVRPFVPVTTRKMLLRPNKHTFYIGCCLATGLRIISLPENE